MKKFLALVLALTMVIALAACGVSTESAAPAAAPAGDSQAAAPAAEAAPAAAGGIRLFNGKIEIDNTSYYDDTITGVNFSNLVLNYQ